MSIEKSFILIKPDGMINGGVDSAISEITNNGLDINEIKRIKLDTDAVKNFYPERTRGSFGRVNIDYMTSGDCGLILVNGENAINEMLDIKGKTYTSGLRLEYANNFVHNTFHCPDTNEDYQRELNLLIK